MSLPFVAQHVTIIPTNEYYIRTQRVIGGPGIDPCDTPSWRHAHDEW